MDLLWLVVFFVCSCFVVGSTTRVGAVFSWGVRRPRVAECNRAVDYSGEATLLSRSVHPWAKPVLRLFLGTGWLSFRGCLLSFRLGAVASECTLALLICSIAGNRCMYLVVVGVICSLAKKQLPEI